MATPTTPRKHTAGLADIRAIIGLLLAIYGVILVVSFFGGSENRTADLWSGIVLLVVAAIFGAWTKAHPTIVDQKAAGASTTGPAATTHADTTTGSTSTTDAAHTDADTTQGGAGSDTPQN